MVGRIAVSVAVMLVGAGSLLAAPPPDMRDKPVSCPKVIAFSDRLAREMPSKSHDPLYIGRKLRIHPLWAERCLLTYGRRLSRRVQVDDKTRDKVEKQWESWPPEQVGTQEQERERDVPWRRPHRGQGSPDIEKPAD
jgi:hypothetical protein